MDAPRRADRDPAAMLARPHALAALPLAGLALAAPAALTAPAHAAKLPSKAVEEYFKVRFSETRFVKWDEPAFSAYEDCSGKRFGEGRGREELSLSSNDAAKMVVFRNAYSTFIDSRLGTWDPTRLGRGAEVSGELTHFSVQRSWIEPGECGGTTTEPVREPNDCGSRKQSYRLDLHVSNNSLLVGLELLKNRRGEPSTFKACDVKFPDSMPQDVAPKPKRIRTKDFLNPRKRTIKVAFYKRYSAKSRKGERPWTRSGYLRWEVVFTRQDELVID